MRKILIAAGLAALPASYAVAQVAQSISAADKRAGAEAHPKLLQEFGGVYQGRQAAYVSSVGKRIAVQSGLSNSQEDFTVSLLNSSVNNAFAIPGGYVYVTRQLMGLMNDEAELASVLGHEVGHVAARHSSKRQAAATRNSIGALLGQVLIGAVAGDSGLGGLLSRGIGQGAQLLTLRFSRTQEYEADDLGIRYLAGAGYDPYASASMLASLQAQANLDARTRGTQANAVPSWASTHPDPGSRVARARGKAQATGIAAGRGARNRDAFLAALDGSLYDDDPRQGVVDGRTFRHPDLRIGFTAPAGFVISNGTSAVTVSGSGGQAQFQGGRLNGSLDAYIRGVFTQLAGQGGQVGDLQPGRTTVNGMDAAFATVRARTQSGNVDATVFAYQVDADSAYHFLVIAPAGGGVGPFEPMLRSFTRLTAQQAQAIRGRKIQVVTVKAGDSPTSLSAHMAYADYKLDRFLTLNALTAGTRLTPGQKVKLVVYS